MLEKFKQYLPAKGPKFNGDKTPMDNKIQLHKNGATQLLFKQKEIEIEAGTVKCSASIPYCEVVGCPGRRQLLFICGKVCATTAKKLEQ